MNKKQLKAYHARINGYVVSSSRVPDGRYYKTEKDAKFEMHRQVKSAPESGIREVFKQEWMNAVKNKSVFEIKNGRNRRL